MANAYTRTTTIALSEAERAELTSMARSRSLPAALTLRARIVLACDGQAKWRSRYMHHRIAGAVRRAAAGSTAYGG